LRVIGNIMAVRDIVVIGASQGGLQALCVLASSLPAQLPASLLIVLHTGPQSPRLLDAIVGRCTPLAVSYGCEGDLIRPGHIYFAPPDRHLIVTSDGHLGLDAGPKVRFSRPAADSLFRSAAEIYGPRVIGVVLTGGDGDGTAGLTAIKAAGGLCVVQSPLEAESPDMPISALTGDHPDHCLPLAQIGPLLVRLVGGP
jgi:two-component system chemotaxis response regulator CheB